MTDAPTGPDRSRRDIWRYAGLYHPFVPEDARVTLGESWTPAAGLPALAAELGLARLVLKREDLGPTGSHKARGLSFQVSALRAARPGLTWLAISSSGNAAIAAAACAAAAGLRLAAFVSPGTPPAKLVDLVDRGAEVFVSDRALSLAQAFADAWGAPNLRPSTDPLAVEGFLSLGWELAETVAPADAVFVFASSGTSFVALGRAFDRSVEVTERPWRTALHAVQGTGASPIAGEYDPRPESGPVPESGRRGRLGALGARKTRRVGEAKRWIRASGGSGWVITDAEADAADRLLASHGIRTSLEGAAAVAAAARAAARGFRGSAVVVLTGRPWPEIDPVRAEDTDAARARFGRSTVHEVDDLSGVLRVVENMGSRR